MANIVRIESNAHLPVDPSSLGEYCVTPFHADDEKFIAGVWSADLTSVDFDYYPVDEVCIVLTGKITLTEVGKAPEVFTSGDAFGLKKGTALNWDQEPDTRKIFVILES